MVYDYFLGADVHDLSGRRVDHVGDTPWFVVLISVIIVAVVMVLEAISVVAIASAILRKARAVMIAWSILLIARRSVCSWLYLVYRGRGRSIQHVSFILVCILSDIIHLGVHSLSISLISCVNPFLGSLPDIVLNFPFHFTAFPSHCDLLDIRHNDVYVWCFTLIVFQKLTEWRNALVGYN